MKDSKLDRRGFLRLPAALAAAASALDAQSGGWVVVDDFDRPDSLYHGDGWETINPGYWKIESRALRRKLHNVGDRNPVDYFPFHWESNRRQPMPTEVDPSLPFGMIWRRDWKLKGNYTLRAELTVREPAPHPSPPRHAQHHPGYAVMGICFGGRTLYESRNRPSRTGNAAWMAVWSDDGRFGIYDHARRGLACPEGLEPAEAPRLRAGDRVTIEVEVSGREDGPARVTATLRSGATAVTVTRENVDRRRHTEGFFGLVARGLLDFEVNRVEIRPGANRRANVVLNECHVCYALGHTLREQDGKWKCRFVALFRNDGETAEIRIADSPNPAGGWRSVPVAGAAPIVNNDFRRNTAIIEATLPGNPAERTYYYTVWKDGRDVTGDPRVENEAARMPGTGIVEPAPESGDYVGRLPRLRAPYRVCGLGGHAIHGGGPNLPNAANFEENWVHDQPTPGAYKYFEEYDFQIVAWEDDVWYLELLFPPPSTDDAYRIITTTIAGPTTRWQFMRHWNLINPGDHDFGMDDIKGPEQYIVRNFTGLGQDIDYMRRNYRLVIHLTQAVENPSGTDNPKLWRRWRMPDGDFTILVLDARRWRTSQDTDIWEDWGWPRNLLRRQDPTRTLLGEEQFAFLQQTIRNEPSPLILLVGINCMHTIFTGREIDPETGYRFAQRDRVAADYAGWVTEGCNRVIELLGSRQGVISVYGDIHLASMVENVANRVIECSFGPIGRSGSRGVIKGFGPRMRDCDGREVTVHALYHQRYGSPDLKPRQGPKHWNFLEMTFDPRPADPVIQLRIRNIVDPPGAEPRGGGTIDRRASSTGRTPASRLPGIKLVPQADVLIARADGTPVRGARTQPDGTIALPELIGVPPNTRLVLTAFAGDSAEAKVVTTEPLA